MLVPRRVITISLSTKWRVMCITSVFFGPFPNKSNVNHFLQQKIPFRNMEMFQPKGSNDFYLFPVRTQLFALNLGGQFYPTRKPEKVTNS